MLIAAQIYQPNLLITEFHGPLTIADPGKPPTIVANWKLAQSSVRGTPAAPERVSLVFDGASVERIDGATPENLLNAKRIEVHGRIIEGSVTNHPVIEVVTAADAGGGAELASGRVAPDRCRHHRGAARASTISRPSRGRRVSARCRRPAGASTSRRRACIRAKPSRSAAAALALNADGRLDGQLRVTVAGLEPFLASLSVAAGGADIAGHGQGRRRARPVGCPVSADVARQQATSSNLSLGINLLGEQTTLEGKRAVTLPLRFDDGDDCPGAAARSAPRRRCSKSYLAA